MFDRQKQWVRSVKRDAIALWIAARDPRVPWYAKVVAAATAAYALSPIDLIPDFIPVIGYLDDLVIVPLGIALTVRLIPDGLMQEFRAEAARREARPTSAVAALFHRRPVVCSDRSGRVVATLARVLALAIFFTLEIGVML